MSKGENVSPFNVVLSEVMNKYNIDFDIIVDDMSMSPIIVFRYMDIEVKMKCNRIDLIDEDYTFWKNNIYDVIKPITRVIKLQSLN